MLFFTLVACGSSGQETATCKMNDKVNNQEAQMKVTKEGKKVKYLDFTVTGAISDELLASYESIDEFEAELKSVLSGGMSEIDGVKASVKVDKDTMVYTLTLMMDIDKVGEENDQLFDLDKASNASNFIKNLESDGYECGAFE